MSTLSAADSFMGYTRADGPPGVRNHVVILSLSGLDNGAAQALHRQFPQTILIGSTYGRGHVGDDLTFQRGMMKALATHPNVGGCVVIGPDNAVVSEVTAALETAERPCVGLSLQHAHEDRFALLDQGARAVTRLRHQVSRQNRSRHPLSALSFAIECGHSDATSGIVSNPLAGDLAIWLVQAGGRAVFSETLEWTGTEDILCARAARADVADAIRAAMARRHAHARAAGHDVQANNPGPQNHAGGITTVEEKSLGAIAKGGDQPIVGLLREGECFGEEPGLYLMDTPCFSPESITSMIASGAQIALFTTGQGNPYASSLAPTIKISANPDTIERLSEQIDIDAGAVLDGLATREDLLPAACTTVLGIADGALTWGEAAGDGIESISRLAGSI
ncbi:MAG: UxaA family hydrolase [Hyphomicrobiaceae bacterium]